MRMAMVFGLALMAILAVACASNQKPRAIEAFTPVGQWRLIAMEGKDIDLPEGARQPTIAVGEDGSVSGTAGINRYSATLDTDAWREGRWAMGPAAMTRMGGTPAAMDFEQRYVGLLSRADAFFPGSNTMDLMGDDALLLRFERVGE